MYLLKVHNACFVVLTHKNKTEAQGVPRICFAAFGGTEPRMPRCVLGLPSKKQGATDVG